MLRENCFQSKVPDAFQLQNFLLWHHVQRKTVLIPEYLIYLEFALLKIAELVLVVVHGQFKLQLQLVDQLPNIFALPTVHKCETELGE